MRGVLSFEKIVVDPSVGMEVAQNGKWIASNQPFTADEFREILKLPLSTEDRRFVEWFQERRNKATTPTEWMKKGFAEHGRLASINRICRANGLMLGIRAVTRMAYKGYPSWPDEPHKFFVLKTREV